jgi:hypothetical protein
MAVAPAFAVIQTFGTDKMAYKKGDRMTFSGTTDSAHANKMISIKIYGPDGNFVTLLGGSSDSDGVITIKAVDTSNEKIAAKFKQKGVYNATAFYDGEPNYKGKFTLFDYSTDGSPVSPSAADLMKGSSTTPTTTPATATPTTTTPTTTTTTQPPLQPPKTETPKTEEHKTTAPMPAEKPKTVIPGFPDPTKDPQTYVDRYNNEPEFKAWFDKYFPDQSIYEIVGLPDPTKAPMTVIPGFPDPTKDPQTYVDRYNNEPEFKAWFDKYFPGKSIYEIVGLPEPKKEEPKIGVCGAGTVLENGVCIVEKKSGGGCLVATAAYGTELAPQVQGLRELRDGMLLKTDSGSAFMDGFNVFYYSFSPTVADWERQSPVFKETIKTALTPLLSSLSLLNYVHIDSEQELLGYGAGIILLNVGMYFVLPAFVIIQIRKHFA